MVWKPQILEISRLKVTIWTDLLIGLRPSILADGYISEPLKSKTSGQSAGASGDLTTASQLWAGSI